MAKSTEAAAKLSSEKLRRGAAATRGCGLPQQPAGRRTRRRGALELQPAAAYRPAPLMSRERRQQGGSGYKPTCKRKIANQLCASQRPLGLLRRLEEVTAGVDGRGLVAVITGATSGIGLETARVLALRGVRVVAGLAVKETIVANIHGARIDVMGMDLSSMASVRRFASEFESLNLSLNILM